MLRLLAVGGLLAGVAGLLAGVTVHAAPASASVDPCALLAEADIRAVQGAAIKERKSSEEAARGLHFAQCVFVADEFVRSVSVTLITGEVTRYWNETFHREAMRGSAEEEDEPPQAVRSIGREAFWTGDARAGVLYVLDRGAILRISVGGVRDTQERLRRTRSLAEAAIRRLRVQPPR
jgi:hypothetical protein